MQVVRFIGFQRFIGFTGFIGLVGFLAFAFVATGLAQHQHQAPPPMTPMTSREAAKPHVGPLPPIPYDGYSSPRPMAVTQAVYEFAARHPEVLQYVPCYCGCERNGHTGNESCFVKSRDARGQVTAWDSHGYG